MLAFLHWQSAYIVDMDACDKQFSCVLLQKQHDVIYKPIGHWARSINDAEHKYDMTQGRCLTVIWAMILFRLYLEGSWFTDHPDKRRVQKDS